MGLINLVSVVVLLASYEYGVRYTLIGAVPNGPYALPRIDVRCVVEQLAERVQEARPVELGVEEDRPTGQACVQVDQREVMVATLALLERIGELVFVEVDDGR